MQNRPDLTQINAYCDETKHFHPFLIQKSKFIYVFLNIILRIYLEDIFVFFRHDAFYKEVKLALRC